MADDGALRQGRPEEQDTLNLAEYLWLIRRGKWIILAFVVVSVAISVYITINTEPVYRSSGTFIYKPNNTITRALDMSGGVSWFEVETYRNDQIEIINSRSLAEAVADSILRSPDSDSIISLLYDGNPPPAPQLRGSLVGLVRGRSSVSMKKDTDFFVLSATGDTPTAAAALANLVMHTYYRRNLSQARGENREVREFLQTQMGLIEEQLLADEDSLRRFKERHSMADLDTETTNLVRNLATMQTQAEAARTAVGEAETRAAYYRSRIGDYREGLVGEMTEVNDSRIAQLQEDISTLETARAELLATGADSMAVASIDRRLQTRREELTEAIMGKASVTFPANPAGPLDGWMQSLAEAEAERRAQMSRWQALSGAVADMEDSLSGLPELEMRLARLERNRQVSENIYILLRTKYEETRISEVSQIGDVTIVDTALPGGKVKPSERRNLIMGLLVGLALGVGTVFLREQLDTSVKSPEDVEQLGISVLGVIPRMDLGRKGVRMPVTDTSPRAPASEAYRDLRTSLRFSATEGPMRSLVVTSAGPREGKSMTVANLAVVMAQAGKRVLLVDTDLRRPVMHNIFALKREPGLTEVIADIRSLDDPGVIDSTGVENLSVLTCGRLPHNPAEMVGSGRMRTLARELEERFDIVLLDSPPVAVVTDPIVLSAIADATLVVVMSKLGDKKVLRSAWTKLGRTANNLTGALLNGFDPISMYTSYGYYTYRYHYYYSDDGSRRKSMLGRRKS
jgi:tyrosine-protein kinase Etk/Wzc